MRDRDSRFVLLHGLRSDFGAFGDSGAAVENLHVVDIKECTVLDCVAFLASDISIVFVMYIYRLGSASDCVNPSERKVLIVLCHNHGAISNLYKA